MAELWWRWSGGSSSCCCSRVVDLSVFMLCRWSSTVSSGIADSTASCFSHLASPPTGDVRPASTSSGSLWEFCNSDIFGRIWGWRCVSQIVVHGNFRVCLATSWSLRYQHFPVSDGLLEVQWLHEASLMAYANEWGRRFRFLEGSGWLTLIYGIGLSKTKNKKKD